MARPKSPAPAAPAKSPGVPPPRKSADTGVTRESLAADIDAFRKAGGTIEVLGITRYPSLATSKPKPTEKPKGKPPAPRR